MFYWSYETEDGTSLQDELLNIKNVKKIKIATAYISVSGVEQLQNIKDKFNLTKNDIELFISAEFSTMKPHVILKELQKICIVKLVTTPTFHPKVYWFLGEKDKLIFGSSNFTQGGFSNNIEFDSIVFPNENEILSLKKFFHYCNSISTEITNDIIQYYEDKHLEIIELAKVQNQLRTLMKGYTIQTDNFNVQDYNLENHYFTYEDYETFFARNQETNNLYIKKQRAVIQKKFLKIHSDIYPEIKKLNIACHRRPENITSLNFPCVYNNGKVAWLGIRYGKHPEELDILNEGADKNDVLGFQKHGCLQYAITPDGFEINLFLAVKHDAIDREYLHQHFAERRKLIEKELNKIKGYGTKWVIYDGQLGRSFIFDIDSDPSTEFYDYFTKNDFDGRESFLKLFFSPDDDILKDFQKLKSKIVDTFTLLIPLYNAMVFRIDISNF